MLFELIILFMAGFLGGVVNSVAGGGSFITFPALLFVGVSPISANATNTFASCAGYLSGLYGFRQDLVEHKKELPRIILLGLLGGISGAWLLLQTSESLFREAIPWLLLFATLLFIFGTHISSFFKSLASRYQGASLIRQFSLVLILLTICVYGGFFNAGLGIILLAYLVLAGHTDINAMNGMKLLVSTAVSLVAVVLFIINGAIAWYEGIIVLAGSLIGGYLAAHISRKLPQEYVRVFVMFISCGVTLYFFIDVYAK